jgi:uncharacterized membrane protein
MTEHRKLDLPEIVLIVGLVGALASSSVIGWLIDDVRGAALAAAIVTFAASLGAIAAALGLARHMAKRETPAGTKVPADGLARASDRKAA